MAQAPCWQGTETEMSRLLLALQNNCECTRDGDLITRQCQAHAMLTTQKGLDDLLFGLRLANRLNDEEWRQPGAL